MCNLPFRVECYLILSVNLVFAMFVIDTDISEGRDVHHAGSCSESQMSSMKGLGHPMRDWFDCRGISSHGRIVNNSHSI